MSEPDPPSSTRAPSGPADRLRELLPRLARPRLLFGEFSEPVKHEQVLALLGLVRFPAWLAVVGFLAVRFFTRDELPLMGPSGLPGLEPAMVRVISIWVLLMVPLGLPLYYFAGGLLAHLGISLTGGGGRSIGASMRAVGLAAVPSFVVIATIEILIYVPVEANELLVLALVAASAVLQYALCAYGLAKSHRVSVVQGLFVAGVPTLLLVALTLTRVSLVLGHMPGVEPPPPDPYYVIPVTP